MTDRLDQLLAQWREPVTPKLPDLAPPPGMDADTLQWQPTMDGDGDWVMRYSPRGVLIVNDVVYRPTGNYCERPMIWLFDEENNGDNGRARMQHNNPPSEAELDQWVGKGAAGAGCDCDACIHQSGGGLR